MNYDGRVEYKNNTRITCVLCLELMSLVEWRIDRPPAAFVHGALQATEVCLYLANACIGSLSKGVVVIAIYRGPV